MTAFATVAHAAGRTDVAVPTGTTVGGLLALLRLPAGTDISLALPDGTPADLDSALGTDLPSGVLLSIAGARATAAAAAAAVQADDEAWFTRWAAAAGGIGFAATLGWGLLAAPLLLGLTPLPLAGRLVAAVALVVVVVALGGRQLGTRTPGTRTLDDGAALAGPFGAVGLPALLAPAGLALADPADPAGRAVALAAALTVAAIAAFLGYLAGRRPAAGAAARLWGALALAVGLALLGGVPATVVAPALLVLGVAVVLLAPEFAVGVPESQLLDLPLLTTVAPAVRTPPVAPPSRITRRRVDRTVAEAAAITDTGVLGGCLVAVVAGAVMLAAADPATLPGQAALATAAVAALVLSLSARGRRSPVVRRAPVLAATALAGLAAATLLRTGWSVVALGAGVLGLALGLLLGTMLVTRRPAALPGRLADLAQTLGLVLLLPGAFLAAGLFGWLWQVAS